MSLVQITQNKQARRGGRGGGAIRRRRVPRGNAEPYSAPAPVAAVAKTPEINKSKLIISNLAFSVSEKDLTELFSRIGIFFGIIVL